MSNPNHDTTNEPKTIDLQTFPTKLTEDALAALETLADHVRAPGLAAWLRDVTTAERRRREPWTADESNTGPIEAAMPAMPDLSPTALATWLRDLAFAVRIEPFPPSARRLLADLAGAAMVRAATHLDTLDSLASHLSSAEK